MGNKPKICFEYTPRCRATQFYNVCIWNITESEEDAIEGIRCFFKLKSEQDTITFKIQVIYPQEPYCRHKVTILVCVKHFDQGKTVVGNYKKDYWTWRTRRSFQNFYNIRKLESLLPCKLVSFWCFNVVSINSTTKAQEIGPGRFIMIDKIEITSLIILLRRKNWFGMT